MKGRGAYFLAVVFYAGLLRAQDADELKNLGVQDIYLPSFEARLSIGFNYDLLRSPLDVSFDNPVGFFGFNVPIEQTVNLRGVTGYINPAIDELFDDTTLIRNGDDFKPRAGARQNPNITVRVDVPMLGGVASFSNIQNFYMNYQTILGNPSVMFNYDSAGVNLLLRGTLNVPLSLTMSWETMTFSYAYNINNYYGFALALHRHVFTADLRGKIDADLLGKYTIKQESGNVAVPIKIEGELDYPSERIHGQVYGYYDAQVWSPTLALRLWRFSMVSRFGISTRAKGRLDATYSLPFFIDPETFEIIKFDQETFNDPDVRIALQTNAVDSLTYTTTEMENGKVRHSDLEWRMPTALTFDADAVHGHLSFSYTKLFGHISMKLDRIGKVTSGVQGAAADSSKNDSIVADIGFPVDHIMLVRGSLWNSYLHLGVFGMDFRSSGRTNILGKAMTSGMKLGSMAMLPVLGIGTALGTRWRLLLDCNILPLPALRSGIFYHF